MYTSYDAKKLYVRKPKTRRHLIREPPHGTLTRWRVRLETSLDRNEPCELQPPPVEFVHELAHKAVRRDPHGYVHISFASADQGAERYVAHLFVKRIVIHDVRQAVTVAGQCVENNWYRPKNKLVHSIRPAPHGA